MRPSPQRHTLAVLRTLLGLTQKEMAEIAEVKTPTIQAIELGKLKMSFRLAQRINFQTGVAIEWLLENQLGVVPTGDDRKPYTKAYFEERQAVLFAKPPSGEGACADLWDFWTLFARQVEILAILYAEAYKRDKVSMVAYKTMTTTVETANTALGTKSAFAERVKAGAQQPVRPERINEITATIQNFALETYKELKRKLKESKQPLSPAARAFVRDYDKRLLGIRK